MHHGSCPDKREKRRVNFMAYDWSPVSFSGFSLDESETLFVFDISLQ